jgi:basic amino acid/polyamine antiporter, APA family
VLLVFVALLGISGIYGKPANFVPVFHAAPLVSILLTLQIVPYFLTGFESVPKEAEEASTEFRPAEFFRAIVMALLIGAGFYVLAVAAVAYVTPWQGLIGKRFATAIAFEQALGARWPVRLILIMAMFGLFQCFNGNFVASSRMLFAFGRRRTISASFGSVHQEYLTPSVAVLGITAGTLAGVLLGDALLVPVTEVGSMASALGWLAACASFWMVEKRVAMRIVTGLGILVSLMLFLMKVLPVFPGHFSPAEWIALGLWVGLGAALHWARS